MNRRDFVKAVSLTLMASPCISSEPSIDQKLKRAKFIIVNQPRGSGKSTFCTKMADLYSKENKTLIISSCYRNSNKIISDCQNENNLYGFSIYRSIYFNRILAGLRANCIIIDDYDQCPREEIDIIIRGLASISSSDSKIIFCGCSDPKMIKTFKDNAHNPDYLLIDRYQNIQDYI
jgi:energy-coupling factor transporter ATP-binding protein EcfA2